MSKANLNKTNKSVDANPSEWVNKYGDYLYIYAYSRVQSKELSEDLVQETFLSALKGLSSFRGDSTVQTWLTSILRRKIIDHYRKMSTKKETVASKFASPFQYEDDNEGHWILERTPNDWQTNTADPLRQDEFQKILELCLSLLPDKWKSVFMLKVLEEMRSDEVCKEIGCTASNLWVIIHRAKLQLRECIEIKWLK